MVVLGQIPAFTSRSMALSLQPSLDTCYGSTSETAEPITSSFKEGGYQFIPIREAHLGFVAWMMGREAPKLDKVYGAAMVNRNFIPLGVCLAYFEEDGTVSIHAHFGKWLRKFPKDVLRHMHGFCRDLREMGHPIVYAIADESVDGSRTLIEWFRGEPTGARHDFGPIYRIDLRKAKI